jgi:hypothetical protein
VRTTARQTTHVLGSLIRLLAVFALVLGSATATVGVASAGEPPPTIASDKADYAPGSTVTLTGSGWSGDTSVHITVNDTRGKTWKRDVDVPVDGAGHITDVFQLPSTFVAEYDVTATGLATGRTATTTFTDASADIDQCANGGVGDPPESCNDTYPANWVNGNLGASKSHFLEGESIPYRIKMDGLTPGSVGNTVIISYDVTKSSKHAIDYLTSFDRTVVDADPCTGIAGCGSETTFPIPADPAIPFAQVPGVFSMFGGTITGATYGFDPGADDCPAGTPDYVGDDTRCITLTFTATTANPVVAWGGHIAARADWGVNNSAVAITGSPYHTALVALNGSGGNQDRSLSSDAVIFPAIIRIIKHTEPPSSTVFGFTAGPLPLSNFTLTDNSGVSDAEQSFTLDTPAEFTTYTVSENASAQYNLDQLSCQVSASNGGSATVDLPNRSVQIAIEEGETRTCTFTNNRATGTLTVIKHVVNDDGGSALASAWSLHVTSAGVDVAGSPQPGSEAGTVYTLDSGAYNVSETGGPSGYSFDGFTGDCNSSGAVTVVAGQNVTCTLTNNDDTPQLKLVKVVTNNDGGTAVADDWTLSATAGAPNAGRNFSNLGGSGVFQDVFAGVSYALAENPNPGTGYSSTGEWSCTGGTLNGAKNAVTVPLGASVTCTITNTDDTPQLKLVKVVNGGSATAADFDLSAAAPGNPLSRNFHSQTASPVFHNVVAGAVYSLAETGPAGYTASAWSCDGGTQVGATIAVPLGGAVTCTITNTRDRGSITAIKYHDLNGDGSSAGDPVLSGWTLFLDLDKSGTVNAGDVFGITDANGEVSFPNLDTTVNGATYWVCEVLQAEWVNSDPGAASVTPNGKCKAVTVAKNATTTVKLGNFQRIEVQVNKTLDGGPVPVGKTFQFSIRKNASTNPGGVNGGFGTVIATGSVVGPDSTITSADWTVAGGQQYPLNPGTYQLCESIVEGFSPTFIQGVYGVDWFSPGIQAGNGFQETENTLVCFNFTVVSGDGGADHTVEFNVDNAPKGFAHTIGFWKNWTSCDGGRQFAMLDLMITGGTRNGITYAGADDSNGNGLRDIRIGDLFIEGPNRCKIAVDLLNKRPVGDPAKLGDMARKASDPVYNSVAQLVAFELNQLLNATGTGSAACQAKATDAALLMQRFLKYIDFRLTATNSTYTMPSNTTRVKQIRANLLYLANVLDDYNNNTIGNCAAALALPYPTVAGTSPLLTWAAFLPAYSDT